MTVRPLVLYPNPWLRAKCGPVDLDADDWRTWAGDLADTLDAHPGVGIAAPQIGILKRLFVLDERRFRHPPEGASLKVFVNPALTAASGKTTAREGCLSIPGYLGETLRARRIEWAARDGAGRTAGGTAKGFAAIALQHELDHINGILFLDRLVHKREALRLRTA